MSRSIHVTRRAVRELRAMDFADDTEHETHLQAADERLQLKRRIKEGIRDERSQRAPQLTRYTRTPRTYRLLSKIAALMCIIRRKKPICAG